jgi:hypothetical protein
MRLVFFALVFLSAVAAAAQVTVGEEIVSDPLRGRVLPVSLAQPAVSIARDRTGVAIAWTMGNGAADAADRIYVARLHAAGHAATVHEIPLSESGKTLHQVSPSLAPSPDGSGFVLGWLELEQTVPAGIPARARPLFCRLDAALMPSAPVVLYPPLPSIAPPLVRTKGDTTWIASDALLWTLKDAALSGPLTGIAASDMTIGTDLPQLIGSHAITSNAFTCRQAPGCLSFFVCLNACKIPVPPLFALDYFSIYTTSVSKTFSFASEAQPAIASNGRDLLAVWFSGPQTSGGDVVALRLGFGDLLRFNDLTSQPRVLAHFPADVGETRPDIATDGEGYVVVWREQRSPTNHDIVGVAINDDGQLTPLSIATSSADERDPAILSLGGGTYLVAYETTTGFERRIAGRFVRFGRHRAVR